jgi:APA family basic amino acid/polyamine antiporter
MNRDDAPGVFLRKASGLVKSASNLDVFIFNTGLISIGIGVLYTHLNGPANYPGGDIGIASLIATLAMLAIGAGMWSWTVTIPRSGAIYVFLSRGASPALGFALSFVDACCWLFYNAVAAVLFSTAGIAPFLVGLYLVTDNVSFLRAAEALNQPVVAAAFGSILIIFCGIASLVGMRRLFALQRLMFAIACVGTMALIACLMVYDKANLAANLAKILPTLPHPYEALIAAAHGSGLATQPTSLWPSIRLSVWPFLALIGGAFSISIGGEVRSVARGQAVGILGSIAVCGTLFALIGWLSYASIGADFQAAVTYLNQTQAAQRLPATPYFTTLVALLSGNLLLTAIICIGFIAWIYFWIPGMLTYAERVMLAWSFDRVAPAALGTVNERYHTPTIAIFVSVIVSVILTWLYACTSFFNTLIFIEAATWAWLITAVVGITFPWRRPSLASASQLGTRTLLGLPLLAVLNGFSAVALLGMGYLLWMDPLAAGHDGKSLATIGVTFGAGLVLFYVMRAYRKRQGIDVGLAYKEIPIE